MFPSNYFDNSINCSILDFAVSNAEIQNASSVKSIPNTLAVSSTDATVVVCNISLYLGTNFSLLSNLIDNSIDAVNTNISEERQIILRIKEVKNNLVIKIKNAFNNEIRYNKEELMSTKEGHSGLGIKSVKSVVSKYQGEIRMDITDNMFSVLIIIPFHP